MRRLELVEIHEQQWFPQQLRDGVTDILQSVLNLGGYVELVTPLLASALRRTKARRVVDLCAGSGGPWMRLHRLLENHVSSVCLTDKFPSTVSSERLGRATKLRIEYARESVDAQSVPQWVKGFRTMFNAFHHFEPDRASDILKNAVERKEGIAIFEVPRRSAPTICATCLMALATFVVVPFIRPFRLSLLLWTYVIPVLPFIMWLDGLISCLRAYTPVELMQLAAASSTQPYIWRAGTRRGFWPVTVTYLIGVPQQSATALPGTISHVSERAEHDMVDNHEEDACLALPNRTNQVFR